MKKEKFNNKYFVRVKHDNQTTKCPIVAVYDKDYINVPFRLTHLDIYTFEVDFTELVLGKKPIKHKRSGTIIWEYEINEKLICL